MSAIGQRLVVVWSRESQMRALLLAGTAAALVTGVAVSRGAAQTVNLPPAQLQGQVPTAPGAVQGANDSNNAAAAPGKPGVLNPVPGSMVIRLNARVVTYAAVESSSLDKTAGTGAANTGAAKVDPYGIIGFMRIYLGMDAMATNGMRYGGAIEVRQNFATPAGGSTSNTGSSAATTASTLYVRRAFGYLAGAQSGIFRLGQADSPLGLFDNGVTTFQNFDDGGWNGDINGLIPSNAQPTFPFLSLAGSDYGSAKAVYLSPQFAGFDFGLSWAPNNQALADTNCAYASSSCYNLSSSSAASDALRYTNWYVAAGRYQNTFGPVGLYVMGAYYGSGHVSYQGPAPGGQYNGLSVGDFGAAVTYAGFTVGGHVTGGDSNGQGALQPKGGSHSLAWLGGVQYAGGPLTIGGSFYNFRSQGSAALVGLTQRNENGLALGLTFNIAPGIAIWASYLYGTRYQGDFNFQTGAVGTAYNNVKSQAFGVGPVIRW
jgi:hypothetical protein